MTLEELLKHWQAAHESFIAESMKYAETDNARSLLAYGRAKGVWQCADDLERYLKEKEEE